MAIYGVGLLVDGVEGRSIYHVVSHLRWREVKKNGFNVRIFRRVSLAQKNTRVNINGAIV